MLVSFHGIDRPDADGIRASARAAHLAFHADRGNLVGGPMRDESGQVCGSLIIFEAPDLETARAEMAHDPYLVVGLFETVTIAEFVAVDWPA